MYFSTYFAMKNNFQGGADGDGVGAVPGSVVGADTEATGGADMVATDTTDKAENKLTKHVYQNRQTAKNIF